MKYWLLLLSLVLLVPNFLSIHLIPLPERRTKKELFNPVIANQIQNEDQLANYIDSVATAKNIKLYSEEYVDVISDVVRNRFFHAYSHYSLKENWIASVCGKLVWFNLSAIVKPDDILKYPMASCSQQAIVLMEFFKRKKIDFRKIAFDHHFAVEGKFNNRWIYFDPDLEPAYPLTNRPNIDYLSKGNNLEIFYKGVIPADKINVIFYNPTIGKVNEYPAPEGKIFHNTTRILSNWLWIVPLACFFWFWRKRTSFTVQNQVYLEPSSVLINVQ